jgi:hypothetical protein
MANNEIKIGKHKVHVVNSVDNYSKMDSEDRDMDNRAKAAVRSAIRKAQVCQQPVAKYDAKRKKAYIINADGVKEYVS